MKLEPAKYQFTFNDTKRIIDLGYLVIRQSCSLSFEEFMVREFPNFDLCTMLEALEATFARTTTFPIKRELIYKIAPTELQLLHRNSCTEDEDEMAFIRTFSKSKKGSIEAKHRYCVLPRASQGLGLIKKVFQISLQQYVNMDLKTIHLHAGLDGGGHVWARHGFVAIDKQEVEVILDEARGSLSKDDFRPVERIFSKYYNDSPNGTEFPMILWANIDSMKSILRGANWHGKLELSNSQQFRNFIDYVFRK